jgi:hypothetical protein
MIIVTKDDLKGMSTELKDELISIMFGKEPGLGERYQQEMSNQEVLEFDDFYNELPTVETHIETESCYRTQEEKTVIEINPVQVEALMSNLREKSINTLKDFCSGEPVHLDSLIGEDKTYKSYNELKRSFVGPVNRRLRTVTKNKLAMLFLKAGENEMAVKKATAISLNDFFNK